jgi:hypothetical protein
VLSSSIRRRPHTEWRSRAITLARLAELHLDAGRLDEAVPVAHAFLDDYPQLSSGRVTRALGTLVARLRSYSGNHGARQVLMRAGAVRSGTGWHPR